MYKSSASASAMYMPTENKSNHNRSIHRQWVLGRTCKLQDCRPERHGGMMEALGGWKSMGPHGHRRSTSECSGTVESHTQPSFTDGSC